MNCPPALVDIIIPCYNTGRYLAQAIDSALAQTYRPITVTVVDDGSTDNTRSIVERYGGKVDYIYQANRGLPGARNTGLRHTGGEFAALLDADDLITPGKIAQQAAFLAQYDNVDVVYSDTLLFCGNPTKAFLVDSRPFRDWDDYLEPFALMCAFPVHAPLVRRRLFERHGFFREDMTIGCEDWEFWLRCVLEGATIRHLPRFHALYRKHPGSMTSELWRLERQETALIRRAVKMFDHHGIKNRRRRLFLACGLLFMGVRCLVLGKEQEFLDLAAAAREVSPVDAFDHRAIQLFYTYPPVPWPILYLALSRILIDLGRPEIASFCFLHAGDLNELGRLAEQSGNRELLRSTMDSFEGFVEKDPVEDLPLYSPPTQDRSEQTTAGVLWELEKSIPSHWSYKAYVWRQLGIYAESYGDSATAETRLKTALVLNPNDWDARFAYARMARKNGNESALRETLQWFRQMSGENHDILILSVKLLFLTGHQPKALGQFFRACTYNPEKLAGTVIDYIIRIVPGATSARRSSVRYQAVRGFCSQLLSRFLKAAGYGWKTVHVASRDRLQRTCLYE